MNYSIKPQKNELNLDNPIFVFYVYVGGMSRKETSETIHQVIEHHRYDNITSWYIPIQQGDCRVECVYNPNNNKTSDLTELVDIINDRIDLLSKSNTFEDFKINIRDWRIEQLTNEIDKITKT